MRSVLILWIIVFFYSSAIFGKEIKRDFSHTFDVAKGAVLMLENGDGNVKIRTWDKDQIKVDVVYHAQIKTSSQKDFEDFEVEFNQSGNKVYVTGREHRRSVIIGYFSVNYITYRYDIMLPEYVELDIVSDDGSVDAENLMADVRVKTDDGDIELRKISNGKTYLHAKDGKIRLESLKGELNIHCDDGDLEATGLAASDAEITSSDGRVRIENSSGNFYISTDDGDVRLDKINGDVLDVRTEDGDVDVRFSGSGVVDITIGAKDGRVNLELDEQVSAAFSVETADGRIRFDAGDARINRDSRRYMKGDLGEGEGTLRIRTADGSVTVTSNY